MMSDARFSTLDVEDRRLLLCVYADEIKALQDQVADLRCDLYAMHGVIAAHDLDAEVAARKAEQELY